MEVRHLWPPRGEARLFQQVRLWQDGLCCCNLALAKVRGAQEPWAVITDEVPSLQTFRQYGLRFSVEELFLDSKSGAFERPTILKSLQNRCRVAIELEGSHLQSAEALERLYLVAAVALLWATCQGLAVQIAGLRHQVDPYWKRGLSYLKIGLAWIRGAVSKGRQLLVPAALVAVDPEPCFASKKAKAKYDNQFLFSRVRFKHCHA